MITDVYINDVYIPYIDCDHRTQIFFGGSSSGKSYFLAQRTVMDNLKGVNYLVVRNVGATLRHSTFNEIKKAVYALGVDHLYHINQTDMTFTCKRNGKQIIMRGLDDVEKLKSITPADGVLERIWIEEATEIKKSAYMQLKKRLRGRSGHSKAIVLSFNPILRSHWIYEEFFAGWNDSGTKLDDLAQSISILKTTYKDNVFLTDDDVKALEDESDPYFYNVYTLGNWGVLGNVIYRNWRTADLSEARRRFENIYNGLDFGYTNPSALVRLHVDEERKKIYVLDELYKRGMTFEGLAEDVKQICGSEIVFCDNEDSRAIAVLGACGVSAIPTVKGPNSVLAGIKFLQGFEIIVDAQCQNFINEIQAYHWAEDKYGNAIEKPAKTGDHLMDALRYAIEDIMLRPKVKTSGMRL